MLQPGRRQILLCLTGVLTGLLWTWSLPTVDAGWLAWICLVPCFYLLFHCELTSPDTWLLGASAGLTAGFGRVYWVAETLQNYGGLSAPLAYLTTILLSAYVGFYPLVVFKLSGHLARHHLRRLPWIVAAIWVLADWILGWLFTGFPWALLGYSQYQSPLVLPIAAVAGVHGLTYILVAANAAVAQLIGRRRTWWAVAALCMPVLMGGGIAQLAHPTEQVVLPTRRVGIVQGSVEQGSKWQTISLTESTHRHLDLARELHSASAPIDLIVFPETAFPFRLDHPNYEIHRRWLGDLSRETSSALLVGSLGSASEDGTAGLFNRAYLMKDNGVLDFADKVHLVPFGEYLPLKWIFGYLDELTAESGAFDPGQMGHKLLELSADTRTRFAVFICYESIFPNIARQQTLAGAQFLINTTNDGWFGTTSAPAQHLAMAVLRAVENGRTVVRAANTGISCFIDANGKIHQPTKLFERAAIQREIEPRSELTFYTRLGDLILAMSAVLLAFSAIVDVRRRRANIDGQIEQAQKTLVEWSDSPQQLRQRIVLISGYGSDASVWAPLLHHLQQSFVDADDAITAVDLRHDLSITDLSRHVVDLVDAEDPRPIVLIGHSLGGLVAVSAAAELNLQTVEVIAIAAPFGGTRWATIARWFGNDCPTTLIDLARHSAAVRAVDDQLAGRSVFSIRLRRDLLSCHPQEPTAVTSSYDPALLVDPRTRHTLVLQDPRILRDIISRLH